MGQMFERDLHDVPRTGEPCMRMSYTPFKLEPPGPQPFVREGEPRTAMVVLPVIDPDRASILEKRAVLGYAVRNAREEFRQVERCVGVVPHPEKEHLPIQIVHTTDRTFGEVGRKRK